VSRWVVVAVLVGLCGGCDLADWLTPVPFTLTGVPAEVTDSIPGQRCLLLVTIENDPNLPSLLAGVVDVTATAPGATVTVQNRSIKAGEVAEISVVPAPADDPNSVPDTGRDITVTIQAARGGDVETATVNIHVTSEEEDLVGPEAEPVRDLFIPWLEENRPALGITSATEWAGTIVTPHILVVTHYLYLSDEWELHVFWHVMIPPYDWARIELRHRYDETLPSLAFEIPSRSADPLVVQEIEPEGTLWR